MINFARALKTAVIAAVIFFPVMALMADEGRDSESEIINQLSENFSFNSEVANHDPFKPVITRKVIELAKIERQPEPAPVKEIEKPLPPLQLKVTGICGNEGIREAIVQFENDEHVVKTGQVVNGKFKVVDIDSTRVVVYSIKEARRATFALTEN